MKDYACALGKDGKGRVRAIFKRIISEFMGMD
jgi:hypothetical protein